MTDTQQSQDSTDPTTSAQDRPMSDPTLTEPLIPISLSVGVAGGIADQLWLTWPQICDAFRSQSERVSTAKDGLLICFAHFQNDYKAPSIASQVFAMCLDFDGQSLAALSASIAFAQRLSTRGIAYSTWSDDPTGRCWRIILPLERPVYASEWADTWRTFASAFEHHSGAVADPQCKNYNRRYYVPTSKIVTVNPEPYLERGVVAPSLLIWGDQ